MESTKKRRGHSFMVFFIDVSLSLKTVGCSISFERNFAGYFSAIRVIFGKGLRIFERCSTIESLQLIDVSVQICVYKSGILTIIVKCVGCEKKLLILSKKKPNAT